MHIHYLNVCMNEIVSEKSPISESKSVVLERERFTYNPGFHSPPHHSIQRRFEDILNISPISCASNETYPCSYIHEFADPFSTLNSNNAHNPNMNIESSITDDDLDGGSSDVENTNKDIMYYIFLAIRQMGLSFTSLKGSPRELYLNLLLKFLDSFGYFCLSQILVILIHSEFGCSDVFAGTLYGLWSTAGFFWSLVTFWVNDNFGVRKALLIGYCLSIVSTVILIASNSLIVLYIVLLILSPLSYSVGPPMLIVGIKRYTTASNRSFAFGLSYSAMNAAAFCSGITVDLFNISLRGLSSSIQNYIFGRLVFSPNRLLLMASACSYSACLIITYIYMREIQMVASRPVHNDVCTSIADGLGEISDFHDSLEACPEVRRVDVRNNSGREDHDDNGIFCEQFEPDRRSMGAAMQELLFSRTFWRFCLLSLLLLNVSWIISSDALGPTYLVRCFGPTYPRGLAFAINPLMIIWLTPIIAATTSEYPHFDMIKYGAFITAVAPFFLAISTSSWALICCNVGLSLGEAIWSPKFIDYSMMIAPQGREASFSALASTPVFLASIPYGYLSGFLISRFLSHEERAEGGNNCKTMWLFVGLFVLASPVLVTVFESCVREQRQVSAVSPLGLVLAFYERCARGRLRRGHLPLHQIEQQLEVLNLFFSFNLSEEEERRTASRRRDPAISMRSSVMTEAEQLYEESYDGSSVCI